MQQGFQPFEIVPGDMSKGLILLCDHARNTLPDEYGTLGLPQAELQRHIAYDIGAEGVTQGLAKGLGVPAILTNFSRLLIDPNRGEDDPTLVRQLYDGTIIKGNYPLSASEMQRRVETFYRPYQTAIADMLTNIEEVSDLSPAVFSVHTMTDRWKGVERPWHTSILWDSDPRFAKPMLEELRKVSGIVVGDNQPYDGALGGDTMFSHCTRNGLPHALIELRQDLVSDQKGIDRWVRLLTPIIEKVNALPNMHKREYFGTRTGLPINQMA